MTLVQDAGSERQVIDGVIVSIDVKVGDKVTLEGVSKKGKERIKQWGEKGWVVAKITDRVIFSSEPGPWLFVENGNDRASRWIHERRDGDFRIVGSSTSDFRGDV